MIPGASDSIGRTSSVNICPSPSIGLPRAFTTLPSIASPTGTLTTFPVLRTTEPSFMSLSLLSIATETQSSSRFCAIPKSPSSNSRSSFAMQLSSPWAFAMPSPTRMTVPTSDCSVLSLKCLISDFMMLLISSEFRFMFCDRSFRGIAAQSVLP